MIQNFSAISTCVFSISYTKVEYILKWVPMFFCFDEFPIVKGVQLLYHFKWLLITEFSLIRKRKESSIILRGTRVSSLLDNKSQQYLYYSYALDCESNAFILESFAAFKILVICENFAFIWERFAMVTRLSRELRIYLRFFLYLEKWVQWAFVEYPNQFLDQNTCHTVHLTSISN